MLTKLTEILYADNGLLVSPQKARIQEALDVLTGLFDRVCLWNNAEKTVGMVRQLCRTAGRQTEEEYNRRMTR